MSSMYKRSIHARSRNNCCSGNAMSIKCYVCVCVSVAVGIQHAKYMIVICGLSGSNIRLHIIS